MFDAFLAYYARTRPRDVALLTPQRRATYAAFDADVNRFAAGLRELGVAPERGIAALQTTDTYRHYVLMVALARLGVASTHSDDARADFRISMVPGDGSAVRVGPDWMAATDARPPTPIDTAGRDPGSLARVMLSSGTTAEPRRIPLTWRRVEANNLNGMTVYGAGRRGTWAIRTGIDSGMGYMVCSLAWTVGAAVAADFATEDLPNLMERQPPGLLSLTPIQLRELLTWLPPDFALKPDWRITIGGGALPLSVYREARERITPDIVIVYGSTESGRATAGPASGLEQAAGFAGWPLPGVSARLVDAEGVPVADGEPGELLLRSDRVAGSYLDDAEATARVFRDGWYHSGDLCRRLPDGALVIEGRVDDRMNIGGVKVMPGLLEDAALSHPAVTDAAAFALPDAAGQDECWLAIVADRGLEREDLIAHLARSPQRLPTVRFAWTEEIPRNAMGKVERAALRAQVQAALGSAAAAG